MRSKFRETDYSNCFLLESNKRFNGSYITDYPRLLQLKLNIDKLMYSTVVKRLILVNTVEF